MYLNYSKLRFDADGNPVQPELVLETLSEDVIGVIPGVSGLRLNIKFSEPSTISFDVAAVTEDGEPNPIYDRLTGHKIIYTENCGIYLVTSPARSSDGVADVKHIEGFSIEYELSSKKFFIEDRSSAPLKFFDRTDKSNPETVLGRVLESAPGWDVGYVAPSLESKYRALEQYDGYLLPFLYGEMKERFRAVVVFDPYARTISAYDADAETPSLPIYLSFDNLLDKAEVKELGEELVTALRPYGADELDIRDVNPTGSNWLYNIDHFIGMGDVSEELAAKWTAWKTLVSQQRAEYSALTAMRAGALLRLAAEEARLADLRGELEALQAQQSIYIQAIAMETTDEGRATRQNHLSAVTSAAAEKRAEISGKEAEMAAIAADLDESDPHTCAGRLLAIAELLRIENYFQDELAELSRYFIEQDFTDDSFVATSVDTSVAGASYRWWWCTFEIDPESGCSVERARVNTYDAAHQNRSRTIYSLSGGRYLLSRGMTIDGYENNLIRGTLEVDNSDSSFVMNLYTGAAFAPSGTSGGDRAAVPSCVITLAGTADVLYFKENDDGGGGAYPPEYHLLRLEARDAVCFVSENVSEYQKYSVQTELYEHAERLLAEISTPVYEFSISSGNFLFAEEFAPFRNELELGRGIYLNMDDGEIITPYIIEFELDFENRDSFSMTFSNRFKRHDDVSTLKDMVEKSYSYSRSLDASKHMYGQAAEQASRVARFMQQSLDSAVNTIIGAKNQSVVINGAGIHVTSGETSDPYLQQFQLRIVNGMIAFSKDGWQTADLAIGVFKTENGYHTGVNANVLAGKLIAGENLIIESPKTDGSGNPTGVMQFKVDGTGVWINNSTFIMQSDAGGALVIDPRYGMFSGKNTLTSRLFTINGTNVEPAFIESGEIIYDTAAPHMPRGTSFYIDPASGDAYFKGTVYATGGTFSGELKAATGTFGGSLNAATGSFAGSVTADAFYVKKGSAVLDMGAGISSSGQWQPDYLNLKGLTITNGAGQTTFQVDGNGNVKVNGDITMGAGSSIDWTTSPDYGAKARADAAFTLADTADLNTSKIVQGTYVAAYATFINGRFIYSPEVYFGNDIQVGVRENSSGVLYPTVTGYTGTLRETQGHDGISSTRLVELSSRQGLLLSCDTNMRLSPGNGKGLYLDATGDQIRVKNDGAWLQLYSYIRAVVADYIANG